MAALAPSNSVTTEQVVDTDPNAILNGGHAVPAALPKPVKSTASTPTPQPIAATPPVKTAAAAPAAPKQAARAMLFKPSVVGSASWIAKLLAALGGAIAAGAVAWFLIRPAPKRNYS
jgi:hypothetical protein